MTLKSYLIINRWENIAPKSLMVKPLRDRIPFARMAAVAQLAERRTVDANVAGSSPVCRPKKARISGLFALPAKQSLSILGCYFGHIG